MVVDGVGSYASDIKEPGQLTEGVNPLARESESYYKFKGSELETLKKVWLQPCRGLLSDEFFNMDGLGALYSRVSSYIFADWNKCGEVMGLAPYGRPNSFSKLLELKNGELRVPEWDADFNQPWMPDGIKKWEASPSMRHWEDMAWRVQHDSEEVLLERARWLRETTGAKNLSWPAASRSTASPTGASCARRVSTMSGSSRPPAITASPSAAPITAISRCRRSRALL